MRRPSFLMLTTIVLTLALALSAGSPTAQEAKLPRVGVILNDGPGALFDSLRRGLAERGYVEGRNVVFEARFARGQLGRVPELARELIDLNVDVIVSVGAVGAEAAKKASSKIPIVFVGAVEPIAAGFAATLERPGGNVTGITSFDPQQAPKQLQMLREVIPGLVRVAFLTDEDIPRVDGWSTVERANDTAARALGIQPQWLKLKGPSPNLENAFIAMANEHAQALVVLDTPVPIIHQKRIAELAITHRLPAMFLGGRRMSEAGGLIAYGTGLLDTLPRMSAYVDKILKGAKPSELPIEVVSRHVLIINLKTAHAIEVTIPPELLKRADQIVE
jgi:putative ABC transport system substrate-binding protein